MSHQTTPPPNMPPAYQNYSPQGAQPPYPFHPGAYQAPPPPKKKRTGLKVFGGILAVLILIGILANAGGDDSSSQSASGSAAASSAPAEPAIEVTAETMLADLEANALKAETTYKDKTVRVTGEISNIDAQGRYFSVKGDSGTFRMISVMANITPEQKAEVAEFSMGEDVDFTGKVTGVGEVMGYSIKVSEINANS